MDKVSDGKRRSKLRTKQSSNDLPAKAPSPPTTTPQGSCADNPLEMHFYAISMQFWELRTKLSSLQAENLQMKTYIESSNAPTETKLKISWREFQNSNSHNASCASDPRTKEMYDELPDERIPDERSPQSSSPQDATGLATCDVKDVSANGAAPLSSLSSPQVEIRRDELKSYSPRRASLSQHLFQPAGPLSRRSRMSALARPSLKDDRLVQSQIAAAAVHSEKSGSQSRLDALSPLYGDAPEIIMKEQFDRINRSKNGIVSADELFQLCMDYNVKQLTLDNVEHICKLFCPSDFTGEAGICGIDQTAFVQLRSENTQTNRDPSDHSLLVLIRMALLEEQFTNTINSNKLRNRVRERLFDAKGIFEISIILAICINALIIGIQVNNDPEAIGWTITEVLFCVVYLLEFFVKLYMFGCRTYFTGPDYLWNIFDTFCLVLSIFDVSSDLQKYMAVQDAGQVSPNVSPNFLKVVRLFRLARLVRLMRFKIFEELSIMIMGLFSGLRALTWAMVLLMLIVYILSVVAQALFQDDLLEFKFISNSMFTLFRCFTDTCETIYDEKQHIPEILFASYGTPFLVGYVIVTMLIPVGLFNLVTAVFIDNCTKSQNLRRQKELDNSRAEVGTLLKLLVARLIIDPKEWNEHTREALKGIKPDGAAQIWALLSSSAHLRMGCDLHMAADEIMDLMQQLGITVPIALFDEWMHDSEFVEFLEDGDFDVSDKFNLYRVLDVHGKSLSPSDLVSGLMFTRGSVSKGDVVSILLRLNDLTEYVKQAPQKLHD